MNTRLLFLFPTYWVLSVIFLSGPSCAQRDEPRFSFRRGLMGTRFALTLRAADSLTAQRANRAVNARMDLLNHCMSDYLDGSEINRLSATGGQNRWVPVSPDLFAVLEKSQRVAQLSNGRFDPTVGPLSLLWRRAVRQGQFPPAAQRHRARRAVGYRLLQLDRATQSARLLRPNMRLDVGGIGQGFAIDEAARVLRGLGIYSFLIDLGGDVLAGTGKWSVALDSTVIWLENAAITTSGDTYRHFDYRGRRYSHVMNPRSGLGLRHFVRATVWAPDGWRADALTKVFSVAHNQRQYRRLLRRFPGVAVLILSSRNGQLRTWQSGGFPRPKPMGD